jgi:hypothetical protein
MERNFDGILNMICMVFLVVFSGILVAFSGNVLVHFKRHFWIFLQHLNVILAVVEFKNDVEIRQHLVKSIIEAFCVLFDSILALNSSCIEYIEVAT